MFFKYYHFAAIWAILAAYVQLGTLPGIRNCIVYGHEITAASGQKAILKAATECTGFLEIAIAAVFAAATAFLLVKGLRGEFAKIYSKLEKGGKEWMIVVAITAVAILPYLARGNVLLGDAMHFSGLTMYVKETLLAGAAPNYIPYWHMGADLLAFYGWLYFLISGAASVLVNSDAANKVLFFGLHMISAILAYAFIKKATHSSRSAVVGALVYSLSFEHIGRVMIGRSVSSLTYALVPALFLIFEMRISKKLRSGRATALLAATASALFFNQPIDAAFIIAIFGLYAAARMLEHRKEAKEIIADMAIAGFLFAAIVSFWAVPMLLERESAGGTGKAIELLQLHAPELSTVKSMAAWPGIWGLKPMQYVGVSALALGAAGIFYGFRKRKFAAAAATVAAITLLLLQSERHAPAMLLLLGLSGAYGFAWLSSKWSIDRNKLLFMAMLIMIADMLPATAQLGYPDFSHSKEFHESIQATDGERVLDLASDRRTFWPIMAYISGRNEAVFGPLIESAPRSVAYAASIANRAAEEYYDRRQNFSEETRQGLYLLGVKYAILHEEHLGKEPQQVYAEKRGGLGLERGLKLVELEHSPIIAAKQKVNPDYDVMLESQEGWNLRPLFEQRAISYGEIRSIIEAMQINISDRTAERIIVKDSSEETIEEEKPEVTAVEVTTKTNKVKLEYTTSSEAFLQLSYAHSPNLLVKIDGKEAEYWKTGINTMAVRSSGGKHAITIEQKASAMKNTLSFVSLLGIITTIYLFLRRPAKKADPKQ